MAEASGTQEWRDITITSRDGIRLYGRHYPAPGSTRRPALCLAGLTRNSRDFHMLAAALSGAGERRRDVFTFDCRGRGMSDHAPNWKDYAVPVEMLDVQDFMAAQQLHDAALVGTSRGGLISMILAAAQPSLIGTVVLNDIGPVIEYEGLVRIGGYVGKTPVPKTWADAAKLVAAGNAAMFPGVDDAEWLEIARQFFNERDGQPVAGYDVQLGRAFALSDGAVPELWPQFLALKRVPCLVVRGALSDLLSAATVEKMEERHPHCTAITVGGQGHAPLLRDQPTINAIDSFLQRAD